VQVRELIPKHLMPDFKQIYREYLNTVKGDIEVQMRRQNRVASRKGIQSLRVVANQFLTAEIRGLKYIQYLEDGVGSHPKSFGRGLIDNIAQWMKDKSISPFRNGEIVPSTSTNIRRAAGAIARSIVKQGTAIRRGEQGLDFQTPIQENMPQLLKDMGRKMVVEFTDKLKIKTA